jgi:hypothetical protein
MFAVVRPVGATRLTAIHRRIVRATPAALLSSLSDANHSCEKTCCKQTEIYCSRIWTRTRRCFKHADLQ